MEVLANVNQFGVCELREDELMEVDGGEFDLGDYLGEKIYYAVKEVKETYDTVSKMWAETDAPGGHYANYDKYAS